MKKLLVKILLPLYKAFLFVAFWWRAFSYEIKFVQYQEGDERWKVLWKKVPRLYSPTFWIGLVFESVLVAAVSFVLSGKSLFGLSGKVWCYYDTQDLQELEAEKSAGKPDNSWYTLVKKQRRQRNEEFAFNEILKGAKDGLL